MDMGEMCEENFIALHCCSIVSAHLAHMQVNMHGINNLQYHVCGTYIYDFGSRKFICL